MEIFSRKGIEACPMDLAGFSSRHARVSRCQCVTNARTISAIRDQCCGSTPRRCQNVGEILDDNTTTKHQEPNRCDRYIIRKLLSRQIQRCYYECEQSRFDENLILQGLFGLNANHYAEKGNRSLWSLGTRAGPRVACYHQSHLSFSSSCPWSLDRTLP